MFGNFIEGQTQELSDLSTEIGTSLPNLEVLTVHGNPIVDLNEQIVDRFEDISLYNEQYVNVFKAKIKTL